MTTPAGEFHASWTSTGRATGAGGVSPGTRLAPGSGGASALEGTMPDIGLFRRNPAFTRFLVAETMSLAGDWFSVVAVSALAVAQGGGAGAWAVGVTIAAHELPMGLVRPFGGVLADRFDRRSLLIAVHLLQALATLAVAWRAFVGDLLGVQLLIVLRSVLGGIDWPARAGALRRLVAEEDVLAALAWTGAAWSATFAFGMALGGLVASYDPALALLVDVGTFVVAAALLATVPAMPPGVAGPVVGLGRLVGDLRDASRLARHDAALLRAVTRKAPVAWAGGAGLVMIAVLADASAFVGSGAATLGLLQATRGVGIGVGPLVAERLVATGWPLPTVWRAVAGLAGLGIVGVAGAPSGAVMLVAAGAWGFGTGANWMIASAELQRRAPDAAIGRLAGLDLWAADLALAGGALAAGAVVEGVGAASAAVGSGVGLALVGWLAIEVAAHRARILVPGGMS